MRKLLTVVGARPQFVKAAMVSHAITKASDLDEVLIHTGQHYDYGMSQAFFDQLDIPQPRVNLGISGGSHAQIGASWVVDSTGNHKVAQAVYHHVEWPWPLPEDLVHPVFFVIYADKRARHDEMVSLDERYEDLLVRYGKSEHSRAAIHRGWEHSKTIERVLSAQLEFPLHESTVVGGRLVSRA